MTRKEAKKMFRDDKDSYGKPRKIMAKIDQIYDDFEKESSELMIDLKELFKELTGKDY